jgi:hypothetical protein
MFRMSSPDIILYHLGKKKGEKEREVPEPGRHPDIRDFSENSRTPHKTQLLIFRKFPSRNIRNIGEKAPLEAGFSPGGHPEYPDRFSSCLRVTVGFSPGEHPDIQPFVTLSHGKKSWRSRRCGFTIR